MPRAACGVVLATQAACRRRRRADPVRQRAGIYPSPTLPDRHQVTFLPSGAVGWHTPALALVRAGRRICAGRPGRP